MEMTEGLSPKNDNSKEKHERKTVDQACQFDGLSGK